MTASIIGGLIALAGIVVRPVSTWLTEAAATRRQRDALLTLERLVDVNPATAPLVSDIVRASGRRVPRRGRRSS
jgi:hypothetical protein